MLEELIKDGIELGDKAEEGMVGKFFDSVEFEKWIAKSVNYLEQEYRGFTVTESILEGYKRVNLNNNFAYYQQVLGVLQSFSQ